MGSLPLIGQINWVWFAIGVLAGWIVIPMLSARLGV